MDPESITKHHVICDAHFPDNMFTIRITKQLNDGAVPKYEEIDLAIGMDMGEAESIFGVEYLEEVSYDGGEHYKIDSIEPAVGFPCEMCNSVFATRDERNDHIDDHFKVHECTSCQKSFLGIKKFEHHRRTIGSCKRTDPSSECITFECFVCHKDSFFSTRSLRLHYNRYHKLAAEEKPKKSSKNKNNICKRCNLTFSNIYIMRTHMSEIHALAGSYVCDVCFKKFNRASNLKWHRLIHDDLLPCKCPVSGCGKFFRTISGLNLHKRTHTGKTGVFFSLIIIKNFNISLFLNSFLQRRKTIQVRPVVVRFDTVREILCV